MCESTIIILLCGSRMMKREEEDPPGTQQRYLQVPAYFWISLLVFAVFESLLVVGSVYYTRSVRNVSVAFLHVLHVVYQCMQYRYAG